MENQNDSSVENPLLAHLDVGVRRIFGHETSRAGFITRNELGNLVLESDVFTLDQDCKNPEWGDHSFGLCKLRAGSVTWDPNEEEYTLELVPLKPRYVIVPMEDEDTGERYLARRKERTITVIATQVNPQAFGKVREQRDAFAQGLMRDRKTEAEALAKASAKASGTVTKKARRKGRAISATVLGSLISETLNGKVHLFRVGGGPEPEAIFDASPEGYAERNEYVELYKDAPPVAE